MDDWGFDTNVGTAAAFAAMDARHVHTHTVLLVVT